MKTEKKEKFKKIILIPVLIISLAVFNFHLAAVFAEGDTEQSDTIIIDTGNAAAVVDDVNQVNTNETSLEETVPPAESPADGTSTIFGDTTSTIDEATTTPNSTPETELEVENNNAAAVENNLAAIAATGNNSIAGSGQSIIKTGQGNVVIGLLNTVNSNFTGSEFSRFLYNIFGNSEDNIDLLDKISTSSTTCCPADIDITNSNQGTIENNIVANVSTGDNSISTHKGKADIETGDANAFVDVFNVLNTNVFGSNWNHLIINVFGNWFGDLILPGEKALHDYMNPGTGCQGNCGETTVANYNQAEIENRVSVSADTGNNEIEGGSGIIRTGGAYTKTNVLNIANSNITGGNWFFMAVNNFGNWSGNIYGLPAGFMASDDSLGGVKIYNLDPSNPNNPGQGGDMNIKNKNDGSIKNSIVVNVSSGGNSIDSQGSASAIETGNANALTNLVNIANSNISGNNWLLGMINVFGEWNGNVVFGQPDLWIAESAITSSNPPKTGDLVNYTLTYFNRGNVEASQVTLTDKFDPRLSIIDRGGGTVLDNPGQIKWDLGTIPAGGSGSVSYSANISRGEPMAGIYYVTNASQISGSEADANPQDNADSISIRIDPLASGWQSPKTILPNIKITKTHSGNGFVAPSSTIDYKITLNNKGNGSAYNVKVEDILRDGALKVFSSNSWDLGEVFAGEEVIIDYTVAFRADVPSGIYTNTAIVTGLDYWQDYFDSQQASTTIEVKREINLDELAEQIKDIENQIKIINSRIKIILPPAESNEGGSSQSESGGTGIFEEIIPRVLAQETSAALTGEEPAPGRQMEKLLAAIGSIFEAKMGNFQISPCCMLNLILLLLILYMFLKDKGKKRDENSNNNPLYKL